LTKMPNYYLELEYHESSCSSNGTGFQPVPFILY